MSAQFTRLSPEAFHTWNSYVDQHPAGTIFHTTDWLSLFNSEVEVYVSYTEDKIYGGIALIRTKKHGVTGYFRPQYTQYFSPLFGNPEIAKHSLTKEHAFVEGLIRQLPKAGHYEFKLNGGHQSILPYHWTGFSSEVTITHVKDFTQGEPMDQFSSNRKREIKKLLALKDEGKIMIDKTPDFEAIWNLNAEAAQRKQYKQDREIFERVFNPDNNAISSLTIAFPPHGIVAAGICAFDRKAFYFLINSSSRQRLSEIKTVSLLTNYEFILESAKKGLIMDFEGSMLRGVESFYRGIGGKQVAVYELKKSPSMIYSGIRAMQQMRMDHKRKE